MFNRFGRVALLLIPALLSACGDNDDDNGPPPLESVQSWTCCARSGDAGDSCECREDVSGRATGCFPEVAACGEDDS